MTGRIKTFSSTQGRGIIETEDGNEITFLIADVLAFDRIGLTAGKVVGYIEEERFPKRALDVFLCSGLAGYIVHDRSRQAENLRYAGFRYENGLRVYSFEERTVGEETRKYLIETEVSLLLKQKVSLQETPALCLAMLLHQVQAGSFLEEERLIRLRLTEADIRNFATGRTPPKPHLYGRPGRSRRVGGHPDLDSPAHKLERQNSTE